MEIKVVLFVCIHVLFAETVLTQNLNIQDVSTFHNETIDDTYVPINKDTLKYSAPYRNYVRSDFFTVQVNTEANGMNIVNDAANEPSLAVDPTNPNRIVMGWRHFETVSSNFRQAGYAYSLDGGENWTFPGVLDPGVFRSDPVLDFDGDGNFYYNSLKSTSSGFPCEVYKIEDGGVDFGMPVSAHGGDKLWMRIDRTNGFGSRNNYSYWTQNFSTCLPGAFTRSTDGSETFEDCVVVDGNPFWGTLAVDSDGVLYLVGRIQNAIIVGKSSNAQNSLQTVTWDDFSSVFLDGIMSPQPLINPQGLLGQAWIDVDITNGPHADNVYVVASVRRDSNGDPGDVMFARSTDGGNNFEDPVRINTDASTSNYQWFGTMAVAPNGRIDIIWLDTRAATTGNPFISALYYSFSEDGGDSFSPNEQISGTFDPKLGYPQQNKMGDYFDMKSDNNFAHIAWANTFTGGQDVYYTRIAPDATLGISEIYSNPFKAIITPNPASEVAQIEFTVPFSERTTVKIYDAIGRKVGLLLDKEVGGKQQIEWNIAETNSAAGLYFVTIETRSASQSIKVVVN
jgi:hypothetical protein